MSVVSDQWDAEPNAKPNFSIVEVPVVHGRATLPDGREVEAPPGVRVIRVRVPHGLPPLIDESEMPEPDSLDAAWAEAEAALWEGGWLRVTGNTMPDYLPRPSYRAEAFKLHATVSLIDAIADTPAAALRALAAKLREQR